ncbi:MAG: hypothetical protein KFB97_07990 [Cyanobium sp. M30B3]|nr:MAG: hypothetical protein KFB97_07990 [Cyanobium sp. M30B3]
MGAASTIWPRFIHRAAGASPASGGLHLLQQIQQHHSNGCTREHTLQRNTPTILPEGGEIDKLTQPRCDGDIPISHSFNLSGPSRSDVNAHGCRCVSVPGGGSAQLGCPVAQWVVDKAAGAFVPSSRSRLRISHLHRCLLLDAADGCHPLFVFIVVQGHSVPCHWAHAYALVPGCSAPIGRHFSFNSRELQCYRQLHSDQSLRWMDSEFMFELALDLLLSQVTPLMPRMAGGLSLPQQLDHGQLLRHYINGDIPLLDALLSQCGEHFLLHRQLQEICSFPLLRVDPLEASETAPAPT